MQSHYYYYYCSIASFKWPHHDLCLHYSPPLPFSPSPLYGLVWFRCYSYRLKPNLELKGPAMALLAHDCPPIDSPHFLFFRHWEFYAEVIDVICGGGVGGEQLLHTTDSTKRCYNQFIDPVLVCCAGAVLFHGVVWWHHDSVCVWTKANTQSTHFCEQGKIITISLFPNYQL